MAQTVLIAAPEHLHALKESFSEALAFSDADALKALEAIFLPFRSGRPAGSLARRTSS